MSTTPSAAAQVAVKLHDALQAVRELDDFLESRNTVEVSARCGDDPAGVNVHGCSPAQIDRAALRFEDADVHRDADNIVKWVEAELGVVTLTFYRR